MLFALIALQIYSTNGNGVHMGFTGSILHFNCSIHSSINLQEKRESVQLKTSA